MKKLIKIPVLLFISLLFLQCNTTKTPQPQQVSFYFNCKINGKYFEVSKEKVLWAENVQAQVNEKVLELNAIFDEKLSSISIHFVDSLDKVKPNVYTEQNGGGVYTPDGLGIDRYLSYKANLNLGYYAEKKAAGTFEFDAISELKGDTIRVTDGMFSVSW